MSPSVARGGGPLGDARAKALLLPLPRSRGRAGVGATSVATDPAPIPDLPRKRGKGRSRAASRRVAQVRFVIPLTTPLLPHEPAVSFHRSRGRAFGGSS